MGSKDLPTLKGNNARRCLPLIAAAVIGFILWAWWRGTQPVRKRVAI